MSPRNILTGLLLIFVGASVVVLLAKETGGREAAPAEVASAEGETNGSAEDAVPGGSGPEGGAGPVATTGTSQETLVSEGPAGDTESKIVVSYLHGRARCGPCRTLQQYATEAVGTNFEEELADGGMEFRVLNIATPQHNHLAQRYQIHTQSVIVSEVRGGEEVRWKNLDRIWQLVRDRDAYFEYIRSEVEAFRSES